MVSVLNVTGTSSGASTTLARPVILSSARNSRTGCATEAVRAAGPVVSLRSTESAGEDRA